MLVALSSCRLRRLLPLLMLWTLLLGVSPVGSGWDNQDPMARLSADLAVLCVSNDPQAPNAPHQPDGLPCPHCPECLPVGQAAAPPPNLTITHRPNRLVDLLRPPTYQGVSRSAYPPRPPGQGPPAFL